MRTNVYIEIPPNTETSKNSINSNLDMPHGWEKRARKLQERRWRKLANRPSHDNRSIQFK